MKCPIETCHASCCYNVPFPLEFIKKYKRKVITQPKRTMSIYGGRAEMYMTSEDIDENKCPFLRDDYKCNIYKNRPDVCRRMAVISRMPCPFLGQGNIFIL